MTTQLSQRYYEFEENKFEGRYWNSNGFAVAVVALVTPQVDWGAYIGGASPEREEEGLRFVATHGNKLTEEDARYFFPHIDLKYRR